MRVEWEVICMMVSSASDRDLHKDVQDELLAHIELFEQSGPQLGRP